MLEGALEHNNRKTIQSLASLEESQNLLSWLQGEYLRMYPELAEHGFQLINRECFLCKFLLKINYSYFSRTELEDILDSARLTCFNPFEKQQKYLKLIEKYLQAYESKKLGPKLLCTLEEFWQEPQCLQIARLLLFMAIRSENKSEFIQRIFQFGLTEQEDLMTEIMKIEIELESVTEVGQVTARLEDLRDANSDLASKYQKLHDYSKRLQESIQYEQKQSEGIAEKFESMKKEKMSIFEKFKIGSDKSYLKLYLEAQQKSQTLNTIYTQKQAKESQLIEKCLKLREKKNEYENVLTDLQKQKQTFSKKLRQKQNKSQNLELRASLRLSTEKENIRRSLHNSQTRIRYQKLFADTNFADFKGKKGGIEQQEEQFCRFEINQSMDILSKLQELNLQREALQKEMSAETEENKRLKIRHQRYASTFTQLKGIFHEIEKQLPPKIRV